MCTVVCPAACGLAGVHGGPGDCAGAGLDVVVVVGDAAFFPPEHELPTIATIAATVRTTRRRTCTGGSLPGCGAHAHAGRRDRLRASPAPRTTSVRRARGPRAVSPCARLL